MWNGVSDFDITSPNCDIDPNPGNRLIALHVSVSVRVHVGIQADPEAPGGPRLLLGKSSKCPGRSSPKPPASAQKT